LQPGLDPEHVTVGVGPELGHVAPGEEVGDLLNRRDEGANAIDDRHVVLDEGRDADAAPRGRVSGTFRPRVEVPIHADASQVRGDDVDVARSVSRHLLPVNHRLVVNVRLTKEGKLGSAFNSINID
jgi:hypothetical protein